MTTAAAVAINARHCRWEMCGRKHFRFRQKYRSRPQASPPRTLSISVQTCSQKRPHCPFMYVSANTCTCAQQCVSVNASVCIHRNVLVCTSLLRCCAYNHFLSPANGGWREGRGEQLTVTPVPRTLSGPVLQLKLDVCALSASSNGYKGLQMSECY